MKNYFIELKNIFKSAFQSIKEHLFLIPVLSLFAFPIFVLAFAFGCNTYANSIDTNNDTYNWNWDTINTNDLKVMIPELYIYTDFYDNVNETNIIEGYKKFNKFLPVSSNGNIELNYYTLMHNFYENLTFDYTYNNHNVHLIFDHFTYISGSGNLYIKEIYYSDSNYTNLEYYLYPQYMV